MCSPRAPLASDTHKTRAIAAALLTQAAVSAAAGVSVDAGKPIATTGAPGSRKTARHRHGVVPGAGHERRVYQGDPAGVTTAHPGGIGDDAVYVSAGNLTTLYVKHAKDILMVRVYGVPDHDKQKSIEKTLALDVLKKL